MRRKAESEKILPEPSPPTFAAAPLFFPFHSGFFLSPLFPLRSVLRPSVRPSSWPPNRPGWSAVCIDPTPLCHASTTKERTNETLFSLAAACLMPCLRIAFALSARRAAAASSPYFSPPVGTSCCRSRSFQRRRCCSCCCCRGRSLSAMFPPPL